MLINLLLLLLTAIPTNIEKDVDECGYQLDNGHDHKGGVWQGRQPQPGARSQSEGNLAAHSRPLASQGGYRWSTLRQEWKPTTTAAANVIGPLHHLVSTDRGHCTEGTEIRLGQANGQSGEQHEHDRQHGGPVQHEPPEG